MTLKPWHGLVAHCDNCGEGIEDPEYGQFVVFENEAQAKELMGEYGWEIDDAGKLLCPACQGEES